MSSDWLPGASLGIEKVGGGYVEAFASAPDWRDAAWSSKTGESREVRPVSYADFLREDHHRTYGRPWILGRFYFDELRRRGLRRSDRVLDVGCGSGRVGIWLIPWLEPGHYCGFDSHLASLMAFSTYEVRLHGLAPRKPRLLLAHDFEAEHFATSFDVVLDFYVTRHLGEALARRAYERLRATCRIGARLFFCHPPPLPLPDLAASGWQLVDRWSSSYPLPVRDPGFKATDEWCAFAAV